MIPGTPWPTQTTAAVAAGELHLDDVVPVPILGLGPAGTAFPFRTGDPLPAPVHRKAARGKRALLADLPGGLGRRRSEQVDTIDVSTGNKDAAIHVPSIDQVDVGQELLTLERLV